MSKVRFALQAALLVCVAAVLASVIAAKYPAYVKLAREESRLNDEIARKRKEAQAVRDAIDSAGTDEFVEKMARERLGMIRADEFRFIIDY